MSDIIADRVLEAFKIERYISEEDRKVRDEIRFYH